ncbi:hypothetical protein B1C78_12665 [Thioalkalivibrio denitrificans]|uniref:Uncharacterized protein n=1 Tax=Thioalkalivibrio denitrificans TaxID=108003 RepID=A0A1V3NDH6_9GAMM|nr:hypothetical protein B1C78_12665 [Thioalkalivibrio denitrificans]
MRRVDRQATDGLSIDPPQRPRAQGTPKGRDIRVSFLWFLSLDKQRKELEPRAAGFETPLILNLV